MSGKFRAFAVAAFITVVARGAAAQSCCGDCNGDGSVTVDEIVTTVILALDGCPDVTPLVTPTLTLSPTPTREPQSTPTRTATPTSEPEPTATVTTGPQPTETPGERFIDNGDGTITDEWTGLTWEKKSDDESIHDIDKEYTWSRTGSVPDGTAFTIFVKTLNDNAFAGHKDWRLPTVHELQDIANYELFDPAIEPIFAADCTSGCTVIECSCTASSPHWSTNTAANGTDFVWVVNFLSGFVSVGGMRDVAHVRAVRSGP